MYDVREVEQKIADGKTLLLAGDEAVLSQLPPGNWIGGTSPYFMSETGGLFTQERICVTELPAFISDASIRVYDEKSIGNVYKEAPENSFCFIIIPGMCNTHFAFALNAPGFEEFAAHPLIGWIAGVRTEDIGKVNPKVFNGRTGTALEDAAVVMQVTLPGEKVADLGILNIFEQSEGDVITFAEDGFSAGEAYVNGKPVNLAAYLTENHYDTKLPLVADYYGVQVNISFQQVDTENGIVHFYAPVFQHVEYRHARPVKDYVSEFTMKMPIEKASHISFSCNCVLNYLYSELDGKETQGITGPITFGEIAYQLLNQTMTYVTINDVPSGDSMVVR